MKQFKDILKEKRKALGLTQYEVADALGTSQSRVASWELGQHFPGFLNLADLADIFRCSVDELMGRKTQ